MRKKSKTTLKNKKRKPLSKYMQYEEWVKQMPQWLKDAKTASENGQVQEANQLLEEEFVQKEIESQSGKLKLFMMYIVGTLLKQIGQLSRSEKIFEELIKINNHSSFYNDLSDIYKKTGRLNQAICYLKKAIDLNPKEPLLWGNLGLNLMSIGQTEQALNLLRKATEMRPDKNSLYSNLLLYMHYSQDLPRSAAFDESVKWAARNASMSLAKTTHNNTPDPERKLKIGYISPDFRSHSVTYFFEPLLEGHNRDKVAVYGYGNIYHYDDVTERLKAKFDHYRNIRPLDAKAAAELIEKDEIDILVDLAGHSGNTGVYTMVYKPAPIQVTWLGYPDTTGMSQMDYRITDRIADPPGSEKYYTEKLFYLPDIFLCYGPCGIQLPVGPLPFLETKHITFGCFNNSSKINPLIIGLWAKILKQVPNSKLLLKFKSGHDDEIRDMFLKRFEEAGIPKDRITISGWLPSPANLDLYNKVDIALDTFPYNGTTTTCQALLMGTPVISLVGEHHMSRVGLSILTNLGFEFFAAPTPEQYVARATALALKPESLAKIRNTMRDRMRASTLCNKAIFAARMEHAYRKMWHEWCKIQIGN